LVDEFTCNCNASRHRRKRSLFALRKSADARSLWSPEGRVERAAFLSIREVIHNQTQLGEAES
jgi:hypothetical protein